MNPSQRIIDFIKGYEKCRLKAYLPTKDDVPTIGWGSTGPDIRLGMVWSQAQADARFSADLARFAGKVASLTGSSPTTQAQFDALVSFAYNVGYGDGGLKTSTLLRMHKAGDYAGAALQFARWDKQAGKPLVGLARRRAAEAQIYRGEA
ncbi:MAG: lysozyme [Caulobacter sp.]|nr:lysozyme [Caulobacter sp.]